jgi:hypothetical protein
MSGYLQRLARNAMSPAHSIHPAVGSIFSPPKEERMPAPLLEYDEIETVENRAESVAPIAPAAPPRAARTPASPANEAREAKQRREDGGLPREAFQPIAPVPRRTAPVVRTPRKTGPPLEEPGPLGSTETEQPPGIQVESEEAYTPLLPPAAQSTEIFRPSQTVVSAASKKEAPGVSRRAAPSKSEPDEIQIHIGRIEVTAVPQTAPRPAVVPPSKSINLDEYLKRGRGRA